MYACRPEVCDWARLIDVDGGFFCNISAQMHALALKDKEEEHAGLLHTAGEIQVNVFIVTEFVFKSAR